METQNERLFPSTPYKSKGFKCPHALLKVLAYFSAALLSTAESAKAQSGSTTPDDDIGTELSGEVNVRDGTLYIGNATLSPSNVPHRFEMLYTRATASGYDMHKISCELDDGPNGEVILRQLGDVRLVDGLSQPNIAEEKTIQIRRSDGMPTTIAFKNDGHEVGLYRDGILRWDQTDSDNNCNGLETTYGGISTFNPATRRLYIAASMQGLPTGYQMLQVPIDAPNYCHWVRDAIAEANREQRPLDQTGAGIYDRRIAGPGSVFLYSRTFANWQRNLAAIFRTPNNLTWPPDPDLAHTLIAGVDSNGNNQHLEVRIESDVWPPESPQRGTQDDVLGKVWDTHAFKTRTLRRDIALMITNKRGFLDAVAAVPQPDGSFLRVPVILDRGAEPDSDGDGIRDFEDKCVWRADPANTDSNGDGQGDACSIDCGAAFPETPIADVPPSQIDANGLRICTDETGEYDFARSDEGGSSLKTKNAPVVLGTNGDILLPGGETVRYTHSTGPGLQSLPSRKIILPAGNSARVKVHSTAHLDGTPGRGSLTYQPYDPNAVPVTVEFNGPTDWYDIPLQAGGEIGLEGSDIEVEAGTENLPLTCPPRCVTEPDGGTPADGGEPADSGQSDGNLPVNDGGGTPDACPTCDPDGGETKPDANEAKPDGGTPNADAGAEAKPDSGQTEKPAKPCGDCNTTGAAGSAILASVIAAMRRRREKVLRR